MAKDPTSIADVIADITKRYPKLKLGTAAEVVDKVEALTTGNLAIDYLTGVGGLPLGRITELYGQPSSGKTTTALQAAAELQKKIIAEGRDEFILYLDFEKALDRDYCAALGLDIQHDTFLPVQPSWLEEGADIAEQFIATGKIRLAIWDSVAKMTPKELEFGVRTAAMERARLMNSLLQRHVSLMHEHHCAGVFLNHLTEAISMGPTRPGMPPTETSPGGKALKFYASLRMSYKQIKQIKGTSLDALTNEDTNQTLAQIVRVKVTKNKLGNPFREADVRVRFGAGFDNTWTALQVLLNHKQVGYGPAGMHFFDKHPDLAHPDMATSPTGRPQLRGEATVLQFAADRPQWRDTLIRAAADTITTQGSGIQLTDESELARAYVDMPEDSRDY